MVTHKQSCRECKNVVARLLGRIAGNVTEQHSLGLPASLAGYESSPVFQPLALIHEALRKHRGFEAFSRTPRLPRVDYFLPDHGIVVEFDESQHFTEPRRLALSLYPPDLSLGFDSKRWAELCGSLNRRDHLPPYRDEQRAWYDTLRDFSSRILENRPTVRIYAGDRQWCAIDPDRPEDVIAFRRTYLAGLDG